jgi:hypothetical protein
LVHFRYTFTHFRSNSGRFGTVLIAIISAKNPIGRTNGGIGHVS